MSCNPCPGVSTENWLIIRPRFQRGDGGKLLSFQKLEERAAGGGDVVDALVDLELVDRRDGIAAAGDRERVGGRDRAGKRLRALRERLLLEHADRAVPDDGAGVLERCGERFCRIGADIEDRVVLGHRLDRLGLPVFYYDVA